MAPPDSAALKRNLRAAGFEVYRSTSVQIHLAERIRDNLIMDSRVVAQLPAEGSPADDGANEWDFVVQATVRSQASHFPGADVDKLWQHARELAQAFIDSKYNEIESKAEVVADPGDPSLSLDTSYEIRLQRTLRGGYSALHNELRAALELPRSTSDE